MYIIRRHTYIYVQHVAAPYYIHKYLYETSTSRVVEIGRIRLMLTPRLDWRRRLQKSGTRSAGAWKRAAPEALAPGKERHQKRRRLEKSGGWKGAAPEAPAPGKQRHQKRRPLKKRHQKRRRLEKSGTRSAGACTRAARNGHHCHQFPGAGGKPGEGLM